ncbi:MAG: hypothetical protein J0H69_17130 [Burkholderiales bacterium]|nr:hypothetical protein [Burkholderiales bacterium]
MSSELITNLGEEIGFYGATAANSGELAPHANLLKAMRDIEAALQELRAENERLKRNRDMWKAQVAVQADQLMVMRKALEPFARCCDAQESLPVRKGWADSVAAFTGLNGPTMGQLRAARASITKEKKE